MLSMIVGEESGSGEALRRQIVTAGHEVLHNRAIPLDAAVATAVGHQPAPRVAFVMCSAQHEHALAIVRRLSALSFLKVVATDDHPDAQLILRAVRAGASDCLDLSREVAKEVPSLLLRMSVALADHPADGQVISVASASGGCGCTTLAVNLAVVLAKQQGRCVLFDLNTSGGDAATMLDLRPQHSLLDLCHQSHQLDPVIFEQALTVHSSGVHLLASPPHFDVLTGMDATSVQQVLQLATAAFPFVVVDLEDITHREQTMVLRASHTILMPLQLDVAGLMRTRSALAYMEAHDVPRERIVLIAHRASCLADIPRKKVCDALGGEIAFTIPEDSRAQTDCINLGSPIVIEQPRHRIASAIQAIAKRVGSPLAYA